MTRAFLSQVHIGLVLAIRNRMGLIYGFLFPLIFLIAFRTLYRHEEVPLALHLGELLTVTILGGACFGLPTTLVNERERGVWRRYRLTPAPTWLFIAATVSSRYLLIAAAALMQMALGLAFGMPLPVDPLGLCLAFSVTAAAFLALGMVIAMLAPNVPAVQALGQCIFLPMLIIGGIAIRISSLPAWALHLSAFMPGRYAVAALQRNVTGAAADGYALVNLLLMAAAGSLAAAALFRWDTTLLALSRRSAVTLLIALGLWTSVGISAEVRGRVMATESQAENVDAVSPKSDSKGSASWQAITPADFARIAFEKLPPDDGLIAPIAGMNEDPDPSQVDILAQVDAGLSTWPPAHVDDPVQRVRNALYVAAVPDLLQMSDVERFLPGIVFKHLRTEIPDADLAKILYWIALHPDEGDDTAIGQLDKLDLPSVHGPTTDVRGRVMLYAFKFLGRLTGDIPSK